MKKYLQPILFFLCIAAVFSDTVDAQQVRFVPMNVDFSRFKADSNNVYLEVYLSFFYQHLQFVQTDSGFVSRFTIDAEIYREDSWIDQTTHTYHNVISDFKEIQKNRQFIDQFLFTIPPGEYWVKLVLRDLNSGSLGEFILDVPVKPFQPRKMSLSDIELCSKIDRADKESLFNKNTLRVLPNPANRFGLSLPVLYYYAEVYNMEFSADSVTTYSVEAVILDENNNIIKEFPEKSEPKPAADVVIVGGHNIITLAPDTYFFKLIITDEATGRQAEAQKRFILYKPESEDAGTF